MNFVTRFLFFGTLPIIFVIAITYFFFKRLGLMKNIIPWRVYIASFLLFAFTLFLFIVIVFPIPAFLYVKIFGPIGKSENTIIDIIVHSCILIFYIVSCFYFIIFKKSKKWNSFTRKIESYPVKKWINNNVKCPNCKSSSIKTKLNLGADIESIIRYDCFCEKCKTDFYFFVDGRTKKYEEIR